MVTKDHLIFISSLGTYLPITDVMKKVLLQDLNEENVYILVRANIMTLSEFNEWIENRSLV